MGGGFVSAATRCLGERGDTADRYDRSEDGEQGSMSSGQQSSSFLHGMRRSNGCHEEEVLEGNRIVRNLGNMPSAPVCGIAMEHAIKSPPGQVLKTVANMLSIRISRFGLSMLVIIFAEILLPSWLIFLCFPRQFLVQ